MLDDSIDLAAVQEIRATIHTEAGPIVMNEFAEFLRLFRIAYAATIDALEARGETVNTDTSQSVNRIVSLTREHLASLSRTEVSNLSTRRLDVEPTIITIHRENPLDIV